MLRSIAVMRSMASVCMATLRQVRQSDLLPLGDRARGLAASDRGELHGRESGLGALGAQERHVGARERLARGDVARSDDALFLKAAIADVAFGRRQNAI